ncbi:tetraspanin-8-like [Melanotaenia boesemani]|uniref:tetraspanin-8-like n=1 Tax=Melanotaenia boesemani TaxID=1250792 RepID=UPI001C0478A3|nr:tetraspanin-8-like [Melanotaenia boesemani]
MGKINGCLKCLFIFFNVLFAIIGCVLMYLAVKATALTLSISSFGGPGLGWLWVIAIGVLGISCLGIFAAASEKLLILKIFAGFMGLGMIIMLIFGIVMAVIRNKVSEGFKAASNEYAKPIMENEESRAMIEALQGPGQCCGISSAEDWGTAIPDSCECKSSPGFFVPGCKPLPQGHTGPSLIFSQTCGDVIFSILDIVFKICLGILFGFAVTALLGLLITLLMIHQVNRHDGAGGPSIAMKGY